MASHLTITSGTTGSVNGRTFAGSQQAGDALGIFAALLDGKAEKAADKARDAVEKGVSDLAATGSKAGTDEREAENVAAAVDVEPNDNSPADPTPLLTLIDALDALKTDIEEGKPLDPDLLAKVEDALTDLAEALGLRLEDLVAPDDIAALLDTERDGFAGALAQMLSPLTQALPSGETGSDKTDRLHQIGDKLAALLAALDDGAIAEDKLAAIGIKPGSPLPEEIEAALARFTLPAATKAGVPEEPILATPVLKTSEPVLAGRPATTEPAAPAAAADDKPRSGDNNRDRDDRAIEPPRRDSRAAPTAAATGPTDTPDAAKAAPVQQETGVLRLDPAAAPRVIQAGYQTSQQQLNLPQIAFELARQVQDGNTRFQIRLDPPELGRIDVRLDIDKAGQVHARLTVEKAETLDLMQRDQRALERALQQAGLESGKANLEFSLKQNPFAGQFGQQDGPERGDTLLADGEPDGAAEQSPAPTVNLYRGSLQASGVNIIA